MHLHQQQIAHSAEAHSRTTTSIIIIIIYWLRLITHRSQRMKAINIILRNQDVSICYCAAFGIVWPTISSHAPSNAHAKHNAQSITKEIKPKFTSLCGFLVCSVSLIIEFGSTEEQHKIKKEKMKTQTTSFTATANKCISGHWPKTN